MGSARAKRRKFNPEIHQVSFNSHGNWNSSERLELLNKFSSVSHFSRGFDVFGRDALRKDNDPCAYIIEVSIS
jgi:hypothetical protein